jgi:hypothetical protein
MNFITDFITSSISKEIIVPVKNFIYPVSFEYPFNSLDALVYSSRMNYERIGNAFLLLKSEPELMEKFINYLGYLKNIVIINIELLEILEDSEIIYEYEYIYSLNDCIIHKEDYITDVRLKNDGVQNNQIIILKNLFDKMNKIKIHNFIVRYQNKILWDIMKAFHGIHLNGYEYGKIKWRDIIIHNNNFKILVDDNIKHVLCEDENEDWVYLIILLNSHLIDYNIESVSKNPVELLKEIDENNLIECLYVLEDMKISFESKEIKYLMSSIDE